MKKILIMAAMALAAMTAGCSRQTSWKDSLGEMMPLLGHRNWIVITDMAYPLQSGEGIVTLFADEPYTDVLKKTMDLIGEAPHVFAHVYHDRELGFITEEMVPGISSLRKEIDDICGTEAQSLPHEDLIKSLDEAGKLYKVVIIKTPMTVPYTTTFFELDCNYWDSGRQSKLDESMR